MKPVYKRAGSFAAVGQKENRDKQVLEKVRCLMNSVLSGELMEAAFFCK
jgi:hypothetical protein